MLELKEFLWHLACREWRKHRISAGTSSPASGKTVYQCTVCMYLTTFGFGSGDIVSNSRSGKGAVGTPKVLVPCIGGSHVGGERSTPHKVVPSSDSKFQSKQIARFLQLKLLTEPQNSICIRPSSISYRQLKDTRDLWETTQSVVLYSSIICWWYLLRIARLGWNRRYFAAFRQASPALIYPAQNIQLPVNFMKCSRNIISMVGAYRKMNTKSVFVWEFTTHEPSTTWLEV